MRMEYSLSTVALIFTGCGGRGGKRKRKMINGFIWSDGYQSNSYL